MTLITFEHSLYVKNCELFGGAKFCAYMRGSV